MRLILTIPLSVLIFSLNVALVNGSANVDLNDWSQWKRFFGKNYKSPEADRKRFMAFKKNVAFIESFNRDLATTFKYTLAVNQFADMTREEFREVMLGIRNNSSPTSEPPIKPKGEKNILENEEGHLPKEIDWRTKGLVTPVKDQGKCGSCWAFSTTGSIEGQHFLKTGQLLSLSEQQLVDCAKANRGCNGGWPTKAFVYIRSAGGLMLESRYPYAAKDGTCNFDKNADTLVKIAGYKSTPPASENGLQKAIAEVGPISVAFDASEETFQFYKSGVFHPKTCGVDLNHAVLAVGYGSDASGDYWLVKNSWNTTWGEDGYFRIIRNEGNMCGIATDASYPIL